LRNAQVGKDDIHGILIEYFQRLFGRRSGPRAQARIGSNVAAKIPNFVFVVDDQHGYRRRAIGCT
jgi:hypothetical protein